MAENWVKMCFVGCGIFVGAKFGGFCVGLRAAFYRCLKIAQFVQLAQKALLAKNLDKRQKVCYNVSQ